ncbi:uncharacterized protein B0T23DRAFT_7466 [Neurospora hispaniola]|uniref:Uncharacterized protein n=1 Tax=Neurospora hispaniola TaxID=588809 RepID=A0AAJ0MVA1_9PEZI|nr:hypothetical protein B0T23DRAFT_7466 [Neurospora hispaniola]
MMGGNQVECVFGTLGMASAMCLMITTIQRRVANTDPSVHDLTHWVYAQKQIDSLGRRLGWHYLDAHQGKVCPHRRWKQRSWRVETTLFVRWLWLTINMSSIQAGTNIDTQEVERTAMTGGFQAERRRGVSGNGDLVVTRERRSLRGCDSTRLEEPAAHDQGLGGSTPAIPSEPRPTWAGASRPLTRKATHLLLSASANRLWP